MHYAYILLSPASHVFYFGSTNDLKNRFKLHNAGKAFAYKRLVSEALKKDFVDGRIPWYSEARSA